MKTNQYRLTIDDIVAFAEFDFGQSGSRRQYLQRMRIFTLFGMLMIFAFVSWIAKSYTYIVLGGPASFAFFLQYPNMIKRIGINSIKRTYLEGENKNIFAERTIDIQPEKIIVNTEYSESSTIWKSIEKLLETDKYIYIYISTTAAHIIPKSAIPANLAQDFMTQAKNYYEESKREKG